MNKECRSDRTAAAKNLPRSCSAIKWITDAVGEAYNNLPEDMRAGERAEQMSKNIKSHTSALDKLREGIDAIDDGLCELECI